MSVLRNEDVSIHNNYFFLDERALVYGACRFGYVFESRTPDYVEINAFGKLERYQILNVIEFTSARKRMSVIIKDSQGKIKLFCKGADTVYI